MNVPNILSIFRIALIPVFAVVLFSDLEQAGLIATAVLAVSFLTDVLDGYIARRYNQITDLGKVLDPVADKLTQVTVLCCMFLAGLIPVWVVVFYAIKELTIVVGGAKLISDTDVVVSSEWYGKCATGVFYVVMAALLSFGRVMPQGLKTGLLWFVVAWALFAGVMYVIKYFRMNSGRRGARRE